MVIAGSALTFLSVFFVLLSFRSRGPDAMHLRLQGVKAKLDGRGSKLDQPFSIRVVTPTVSGLAKLLMKLLPTTWIKVTSQRLAWADIPMQLGTFVIFWALSTIGFGFLAYFWAGNFGFSPLINGAAILVGVVVGAYAPQFWLKSKIGQRHYITRKSLPDVLDMMVTSVEAGLSLDSALMHISEYNKGPFQKELARALQDMALGQSRAQALTAMTERLNVPELVTFVQTLNQAEITGAPIGQVIRVQAEQVRIGRRQAAEEQAQKAPLLMLIPLVLFILPSLFIVLLSPAVMNIIEVFSNGGFSGR